MFCSCCPLYYANHLVGEVYLNLDMARDFIQCDILTNVDSDEPVQLPFKLKNCK